MATWCRYLVRNMGNARKAWRQFRADDPTAPSRHTLYKYRRGCSRFAEEWADALNEVVVAKDDDVSSIQSPALRPLVSLPTELINYW